MSRASTPEFQPGDLAILRGSFEVVEVVAALDTIVLVKRAGGQMAFDTSRLEPYSDTCPLP